MKTKSELTELPNIGPKMAALIEEAGIKTVEQFLKADPYKIFSKMLKQDPTLCRCCLSSVVGARAGVKWPTLHKEAAAEFEKLYPKHQWKNKC